MTTAGGGAGRQAEPPSVHDSWRGAEGFQRHAAVLQSGHVCAAGGAPGAGANDLTTRGDHWVFDVIGTLKPGVSEAQAVADLNGIGNSLMKAYPKDEKHMAFTLTRPGLYGIILADR